MKMTISCCYQKAVRNHKIPYVFDKAVIITKRLKASYIYWVNENPIFIYRFKGTTSWDTDLKVYFLLSFTPEYVREHTDENGYVDLTQEVCEWRYYSDTDQKINQFILKKKVPNNS